MRKKVILRADDLGYSKGVNLGIAESVIHGLVNTVGLIVNLDDSEHGFKLLKDADICLGLHVNISMGRPVSDPADLPSITNEQKRFRSTKTYTSSYIRYEEVYAEVEAQYQYFKHLTNREPDYMEGHAIFHEVYFKAIKDVAEKYNILFVPSLTTSDEALFVNNYPLYFWMESMKDDYDPYKTFQRLAACKRSGCEVMILHPGYIDQYLLTHSSLVQPRVKEVEFAVNLSRDGILGKNNIELVTYKDIKGRKII